MAKKALDLTIPTAVFVVLIIFFLLATLHYSAKDARAQAQRREIEGDIKAMAAQEKDLDFEIRRLRGVVLQRETPFSAVTDEAAWKDVFKVEGNATSFAAALNGQVVPASAVSLVKELATLKPYNYGSYQNLLHMNQLLTTEAAAVLIRVPEVASEVNGISQSRIRTDAAKADVQRNLKSQFDEIEALADNWTTRLDEERGKLDNRISELEEAIEDKDKEVRRLTRDLTREKNALETRLHIKEDSIEILIEREIHTVAEMDADGAIDHADMSLGKVWINIGERQGVQRGQRFEVFQFVKGGHRRLKGMIEVRKVGESQSQCAVVPKTTMRDYETGRELVRPDPYDPIVAGDLIRSPFFEAGHTPVFVFLGDEFKNPLFRNRTDAMDRLTRMIEKAGARVEKKVSVRTDLAIIKQSPESDDGYQQALQFGVILMDEQDIYKFLEP